MKRFFFISLFLAVLSSGCAVTYEEFHMPELERRFVSLRQIHQGMTREEVVSLLGDKIVVGYELVDSAAKQYNPITLTNPHKVEHMRKGTREYEIDYYLAGIKTPDNNISEEELVPLVFRDNKLIGMGWEFLNQKIKN